MAQRLLAVALILAAARAAPAQTADEIIERHIAAIGGRAAHAKVRSRFASGTVTLASPAGDLAGTIELWNEAPNKSRTLLQVDLTAVGAGKLVFDQRFDGNNGYVLDSLQGNHEISGGQLDTMRSGSFPDAILNYKELGSTVKLAGREKVGDREAFVLDFEPVSGWPARNYIDTETYMTLQAAMTIRLVELDRDVEQMTVFSDYRAVDGIKLPFHVRISSPIQTITISITHSEHNVRIDPALFTKP